MERLVVRHTYLASGPECPSTETASNNRGNPRCPHWNLEAADMNGRLIESAHYLPESDEAEDRA